MLYFIRYSIGALFLLGGNVFAQELKLTALEALSEKMAEKSKPVVVFLHTQSCSYCALMEKKTFADKEVIDLLNTHFYFVSFDAEYKKEVIFNGEVYRYKKRGIRSGTHEVATLFDETNTYPALIFINKKREIIYTHRAYVKGKELVNMLQRLM